MQGVSTLRRGYDFKQCVPVLTIPKHKPTKKTRVLLDKARAETKTKPVILIADTSSYILSILAGTFQLNNFTVYTASSAAECLSLFSGLKDSIDIILMDGAIAGDHGVEVIINVRRIKRDQKIMVVVEDNNLKAATMKVGADVVVMKPISPDSVLHHVNDMLLQTVTFMDKKKAKFQRVH
ncbi:MAG TPA: response regulator [Nitrososphaera sp.]|nr:response regulator [Nitrososphaera sp.]